MLIYIIKLTFWFCSLAQDVLLRITRPHGRSPCYWIDVSADVCVCTVNGRVVRGQREREAGEKGREGEPWRTKRERKRERQKEK